jgi:hypothetical protein
MVYLLTSGKLCFLRPAEQLLEQRDLGFRVILIVNANWGDLLGDFLEGLSGKSIESPIAIPEVSWCPFSQLSCQVTLPTRRPRGQILSRTRRAWMNKSRIKQCGQANRGGACQTGWAKTNKRQHGGCGAEIRRLGTLQCDTALSST